MTPQNPTPRAGPDRRVLAAAGLLGAIVIAALILIATSVFGDDDPSKPGGDPTSEPKPGSSSSCGLPDGDQAVPAKGPEADWQLRNGFAAPSSKNTGPGRDVGNVRSCFSRSPSGVLFALANWLGDTAQADFDKDQLLARIYEDSNKQILVAAIGTKKPGSGGLQIVGFRFQDFTRSRTAITMALRLTEGPSAGRFLSVAYTLGWQHGDWRIVTPPGGEVVSAELADVSQFTEWGGA